MKNALKGYKTYIVCALTILYGVGLYLNGSSVSEVLAFVFAGTGGASLRAAIGRIEAKVLSLLPPSVDAVVKPIIDDAVKKVEG